MDTCSSPKCHVGETGDGDLGMGGAAQLDGGSAAEQSSLRSWESQSVGLLPRKNEYMHTHHVALWGQFLEFPKPSGIHEIATSIYFLRKTRYGCSHQDSLHRDRDARASSTDSLSPRSHCLSQWHRAEWVGEEVSGKGGIPKQGRGGGVEVVFSGAGRRIWELATQTEANGQLPRPLQELSLGGNPCSWGKGLNEVWPGGLAPSHLGDVLVQKAGPTLAGHPDSWCCIYRGSDL